MKTSLITLISFVVVGAFGGLFHAMGLGELKSGHMQPVSREEYVRGYIIYPFYGAIGGLAVGSGLLLYGKLKHKE